MKTVLHKSFFLLVFILYLVNAQTPALLQKKYTFDLPEPKVNNLTSKTSTNLTFQQYSGEVLKEFVIKQPKQIDNVFQIIVKQKPGTFSFPSVQTQVDESELLSAPELDEVWFDTYTWPIKKRVGFYSLQKNQSSLGKDELQIVSVVLTSNQQDDNQPDQQQTSAMILLSSGEIGLIKRKFQNFYLQKSYVFQQINDQIQKQQKQWEEAQIYHKNGHFYLFLEMKIYHVTFKENQALTTNRSYTLEQILTPEQNPVNYVQKIVQTPLQLHLFTKSACYKLNGRQVQLQVDYTQIQKALGQNSLSFSDFTVYDNVMYLLSKQVGLIKYPFTNSMSLFKIQHPALAKSINVYKNTFMITYEFNRQNVIQEYQYVESQRNLYVNKVYTHRSEEDIEEILIFEQIFVVNRGSEITTGLHSLGRNLPFPFHKRDSILQSYILLNQVLQLRSLSSGILSSPKYLIVTSNSFELVEFEQNQCDLQQKWVTVTAQKKGNYEFDIEFIGTCRDSSFQSQQYCSMTKSIRLNVDDYVGNSIRSWWIWVCIAGLMVCFLVAVLFVCWRYFSKKQNEFETLLSERKRVNNASTVIQMSFEKTTQLNR